MSFELGTILFLFGFLCGFIYAYFHYRPSRKQQADAADKAVKKILKELKIKEK